MAYAKREVRSLFNKTVQRQEIRLIKKVGEKSTGRKGWRSKKEISEW